MLKWSFCLKFEVDVLCLFNNHVNFAQLLEDFWLLYGKLCIK